jgi:hypothetical protein
VERIGLELDGFAGLTEAFGERTHLITPSTIDISWT